jgi:hypothetical protein
MKAGNGTKNISWLSRHNEVTQDSEEIIILRQTYLEENGKKRLKPINKNI